MAIKKEAFRDYALDEDKIKPDIFSVRLNKEERDLLEEIKKNFNIKSDSKALKVSARIGYNVIRGMLGPKVMRYLFKKKRDKLEDYKDF